MPQNQIKSVFFHAFLLLGILAATGPDASAQRWEFGAGGGVMHYKGDISPALRPGMASPAGQVFGRYHVSKAVALRAQATMGKIAADDRKSPDPFQRSRGVYFTTGILETGADLAYNFLDFDYEHRRRNWSPYLFGGLSYFLYNPDGNSNLSFRKGSIALPYGAGIRWQIKGPWNLNAEFGTRHTWTDLLDKYNAAGTGVSRAQQSDPQRKDRYYFTSLTLSYTLLRVVCPR